MEKLGCHSVSLEQNGGLYVAALPEGNNKRSVQIRNNEYLNSNIRSRGIKGDIYSVVRYIKKFEHNHQAKKWIEEICKYNGFTVLKTEHPLEWLKEIKKKRKAINYSCCKNEILNEDVLDNYLKFPHIEFTKDGIGAETQDEFDICYDPIYNRIIIPIRDLKGNLIGLKARNLDAEEINKNMKYIYVKSTHQSKVLFNYHRALTHIIKQGFVIVGEAEKFPMQLHEMEVYNAVSLGCSDPSDTQIKLLREMEVPIVVAYDKGIDLDYIKEKYRRLGLTRNIYVVYDTEDILDKNKKESPTDRGKKIWDKLFESKIRIY